MKDVNTSLHFTVVKQNFHQQKTFVSLSISNALVLGLLEFPRIDTNVFKRTCAGSQGATRNQVGLFVRYLYFFKTRNLNGQKKNGVSTFCPQNPGVNISSKWCHSWNIQSLNQERCVEALKA